MAKIEFSFANGIFVNLLIEWSVAEQNHPVDKIIFWREINDKRFSSHSASEKDLHYGIRFERNPHFLNRESLPQ